MESGDVYRNGEYICTVRTNGDIYHNGEYLGTIRENGDIFRNGEFLGSFDGGSDLRRNGEYLGSMRSNGSFFRNGEYLGTFYGDGNGDTPGGYTFPNRTSSSANPSSSEPFYSTPADTGGSEMFLMPLAFIKLLIKFWPVTLICLLMGVFLAFLTGVASHAGQFYMTLRPFEPVIFGVGIVGIILLAIVRFTGPTADKKWLSILGSILIYLAACWIAFFKTGLIAAWGFPAAFLGGEEYRMSISQGLFGCPGSLKVFEWFIHFIDGSKHLVLNNGIVGIFDSCEALIWRVMTSGMPVLLAFVTAILLIPVAVVLALIPVFIAPILCFLVPFIPGFFELLAIGMLMSIGLRA